MWLYIALFPKPYNRSKNYQKTNQEKQQNTSRRDEKFAENEKEGQSKYEETYGKTSAESKDAVTLPDTQELEEAYNLAKLNTARVQAELDTAKQALEQAKAEHKAKVDSVESKVDEAQKAKN